MISSLDELDAWTSVLPVRGAVLRYRGSSKLINGMKKLTSAQSSVTRSCRRKKST
jgi:hypothetical protein